jgi:hypothetical protein
MILEIVSPEATLIQHEVTSIANLQSGRIISNFGNNHALQPILK